jgi:superfamily II DNA helicase RecQ
MTDFIQESDKVARNLKSYTSVLFVNEKEYTTKNIDLDVEVNFEYFKKIDYNVLCDFIHEKTCRRKIISKYYDNKIISQCDVNIQVLCDLCEKRSEELNKRKDKQLTSENVNYLQLEKLKDKLISLQDIVIF